MPQDLDALSAIDIDRAGSVKEVGVTAQTGAAAPKNRDAIPCRPHPVRKLEARPYRPLGDEPEPGLLLRGLRRRARRARPCGPRGSGAPGTAPRPRPAGRPPRASRAGRSGGGCTTLDLRLISRLARSWRLLARRCLQWGREVEAFRTSRALVPVACISATAATGARSVLWQRLATSPGKKPPPLSLGDPGAILLFVFNEN